MLPLLSKDFIINNNNAADPVLGAKTGNLPHNQGNRERSLFTSVSCISIDSNIQQ
jgi:hypothetical protein